MSDDKGTLLKGATVQFYVGNQRVHSAVTDSKGVVSFKAEKATYTVKVTLADYTGETQYKFSANSTELKVKLKKNVPVNEYDQFGDKKFTAEAYSTNFELWPSEDNEKWNARAFFQMCVVMDKSQLDLTPGIGTKNYAYKFEMYYRIAGSKDKFNGGYTVPMETLYDWGDSAIYRFQVAEAPEGDLVENWKVGERYEVVIKYKKGSTVLGYSSLIVNWNQEYSNAYKTYNTFWTRHIFILVC